MASSQWARPGIAPRLTPTKPLVRLQPTSPGDPDPEVTALGRELKEAAFPFDSHLGILYPSSLLGYSFRQDRSGSYHWKGILCWQRTWQVRHRIKVETVQSDDESSDQVAPSSRQSSIKSISLINSDPAGTVDPLKTPKQEILCPREDQHTTVPRGNTRTSTMSVTQDDWINLIRRDPNGF
jgi:hypothetical protein